MVAKNHSLALLLIFVGAAVAGALGGVAPRVALAQDDVLEANKELVATLYDEIVNNRNFEALLDAVAPGLVEHTSEGDVVHETPEDFVAFTAADMEQVPDEVQVTINYQIAEGDQVVNHLTLNFTESGFSVNGISVFRVEDGKIVEMEEIIDEAAIMTQMGMMPEMGDRDG